MRDVLRSSLGRSLQTLPDEDRLAAAWAVACGPVLAERAEVLRLDAEGVLQVRVLQPGWREQFMQMRSKLTEDLRRIAGVRLQAIHFEGQDTKRQSERPAATAPATMRSPRVKTAGRRKILEKHS